MKRIAIITEGGVAMGLGHVQRMLTLAGSLSQVAKIIFITSSGQEVQDKITSASYELITTRLDYLEALALLLPLDVVIIDKLTVDATTAAWVREHTSARLVIFGNTSSANTSAHLVVNSIIGTGFRNQRFLDRTTGTLYLEGPRYVILGEAFRGTRGAFKYRGTPERILLMFGGSDQANLTCRVSRELRAIGNNTALVACVGAAYPHGALLDVLAIQEEGASRSFKVIRNSNAVAQLMLNVDLLITSPGNSLFEAISLGLPAVAFFQTEAQSKMFRGFPCCHEQNEIENIGIIMGEVFNSHERYHELMHSLELGRGYSEIIDGIAA